ncbi:MAG: sugar ABC transporter substrate-binding protein [Fimbriimonadaceae bacterium]|nr:sugar ABC transporter substrate-binding protein [Fimbriimonadaceae bacterium]
MQAKSVFAASAIALLIGVGPVLAADTLNVLVEAGGHSLQQAIADQFTKETGITVNFVEVPYQGVFDKLSAELGAGTSNYDVATIDVTWMAKFASFAEPLDSLFTDAVKKDIPPALLADAQVGGRWVGMPTWANAEILLYRKDLFSDPKQQAAFKAKYGYDLVVPTNWKQFEDAATFFTQDTNGDGKPDLYGTDVIGVYSEEWMAQVLQAGSPGVVLDDKGNVIIDNAAHLKALQYYTDIYCKDHAAPDGVLQVDWGAAQNMFYQGKTAMMKFWAHAYRQTPADSVVAGKVGAAPMIAGDAGVAAITGPWYNIVPMTSTHKDEAKQFVAYAFAHNALGIQAPLGLAASNSAYASYEDKPGYEHFRPLLATLAAPATKGRPLVTQWQEIVDQAVTPMLQQALSCKADLPALLKTAKTTIEGML